MASEKYELESQFIEKRKAPFLNSFKSLFLTAIALLSTLSALLLLDSTLKTRTVSTNSKYDEDFTLSLLLNPLKTKNLAGEWLKNYTKDNQLAGTNFNMVNFTLNKFLELGLDDAYIDEYTSFMSYPLNNSLSLIDSNSSVIYKPSLIEDKINEDPNSFYDVPAFLGYAANGNITAQYIYCNYGSVEDFENLEKLNIDLKGKIAIVRYGKIFRGLKIKLAQERGMIGVLIYTDIYDDGEVTTDNGFKSYPNGFARNPSAIQRGSSQFLSKYPGDPTTPGYALKPGENGDRVSPYDTIPTIPALPISFKDVEPILQKISGHGKKISNWKGSVKNYDYSIGPNPNYTLNLYNNQDFNITTMYNIMGKITGEDDSKFILIGNHHDSWTPAAGDPHSGSATLLEVIRAFGKLKEIGWKPRISIIFASWDGEEYGLIGSTEFGEYYQHKLKRQCIAYINTDVSAIGSNLKLESSPLLNDLLLNSAKQIDYTKKSQTLYDHFLEKQNGKIGTLGSGSDFTVFLEHLGIPSVDMGFTNDLTNSSVYPYHSLYDSYNWMEKFGDPGFIYHNLMAQYMSTIILHLSNEPVLRLRTHDYSIALSSYFNDLNIPKQWLNGKKCNNSNSVFENLYHHNKTGKVSYLIKKIENKLSELNDKTIKFDSNLEDLVLLHKNWDSLTYWEKIKLHFRTKKFNFILQYFERHFLDEEGLKDRPWFKHFIYASGRYTGYKGQELPALAEAIEDLRYKDFVHKLRYFDEILNNLLRMTTI